MRSHGTSDAKKLQCCSMFPSSAPNYTTSHTNHSVEEIGSGEVPAVAVLISAPSREFLLAHSRIGPGG